MQSRMINLTQINDSFDPVNNFALFNLLINNPDTLDYQAGEIYSSEGGDLKLSHSLKATDINPFTPNQAYVVLNEKDEIIGDLHLLNIGMVYFRAEMPMTSVKTIAADVFLTILQERVLEYIRDDNFQNPNKQAWQYLLEKLKGVDASDSATLEKYTAFYYFYASRLSESLMCPTMKISRLQFGMLAPAGILKNFLQASKDIPIFPADRDYFFQKKKISFDDCIVVRRARKENRGECLDLLDHDAVGFGGSSSVYRVKNVFVTDQSKKRLKHPYVYKISNNASLTLKDEFEDTKSLAHLARSRNYHPGFYAMPDLGKSLYDFLEEYLFAIRDNRKFIHEVLRLTAALFSAVDKQLNGKLHGDLKHDNFCIDKLGNITIIDYSKSSYFTPPYASPEVLKFEVSKAVNIFMTEPTAKMGVVRLEPKNFTIDSDGNIQMQGNDSGSVHDSAKMTLSFGRAEDFFAMDYFVSDLLNAPQEVTEKSDIYSVARMLAEIWNDPNEIWNELDNFVYIYDTIVTDEPDDLLAGLFGVMKLKYSEKDFPRDVLKTYQSFLRICHASNPENRPSAAEAAAMSRAILNHYEALLGLEAKSKVRLA